LTGATPTVLMVTGAYFPETSGAGLQCRSLVAACRDRVRFSVLTTVVDAGLPLDDEVDGVPVRRVRVHATSRAHRALATPHWLAATLRAVRAADIVHLHGFSTKSHIVVAVARALGRPIVVKLTSIGHDDAVTMRSNGGAAWRSFRRADRFVGISPRFGELHAAAGLPARQLVPIPNGVDLDRFRPPAAGERAALRRDLGLPADLPVVLFVGFFSHEKRPDLAFDAWVGTFADAPASAMVFVGRTESPYYEIDAALAERIHRDAARLQCTGRVMMIEETQQIERYYRAADVLIFPSTREGLPNVVLEAMASGLPCIVSRLPGVTDAVIADGVDGLLVDPADRPAFSRTLALLLREPERRDRLGAAARRTAAARFSLQRTADAYVALYREMMNGSAA
jgi:glycosyltransferase involved in cell wall biosynthesis